MKKITPASIIIFIYTWFLIFMSLVFSSLKEESFIDGDEIKNICDVVRVFVVDDHRGPMAIAILVAIIPAIAYSVKTKFKHAILNVSLIFFFLVWGLGFIYKYRNCLWF
ncbi:DUF2645 family protein [Pectobacterium brasiliense]|uniref:DUF2645 family protein n=1 Tax=Pectobacterium brasiliense TaxID=180957 RepID=A0AAE3BE28_9GAMM|nr:DUF2645 family protein [Pectobacterium brasiliense]ARA77757.1 hypothetical protein B5S52_18465 [Pectobacterium brasiliense]MBN3051039.1 DUF2645 family protein [Pectobacterium brasiliense]MBN3262122.1 DUF2645 family protein [Pectobacterium brasiliense]MDY4379129.1 DUF2645 family protein [Pectobacterium brasiliense]WJM83140.1 DUF2645 family protein [Pectobacterium brasiliense]